MTYVRPSALSEDTTPISTPAPDRKDKLISKRRRIAVDIQTNRLSLVLLDRQTLAAISEGGPTRRFTVPQWWPDETDRPHVQQWLKRAMAPDPPPVLWGPRGVVLDGRLIGHAGFHGPPTDIKSALDDPTYSGLSTEARSGVVEIGYTILAPHRGNGYGGEAAAALIEWAKTTGEVSTIIATVLADNAPSIAIVKNLGDFHRIGTCRDDDGQLEDVYRLEI